MFIPSAFEERFHNSFSFFSFFVCVCGVSTFTHTPERVGGDSLTVKGIGSGKGAHIQPVPSGSGG